MSDVNLPMHPGRAGPTTSWKAMTSVILGVAGLVPYLGFILGPAALILARSARKDMRANPGVVSGQGLARAGLVLGTIDCIIAILAIAVLAVVFYVISGAPWRS